MANIHFDFRRGGGAGTEILYGEVSIRPTTSFARGTSLVVPANTTLDLVDGEATLANVAATPAPVEGSIEWAYVVKVTDRLGKSFEWMVGVPDTPDTVEFASLPRYYETKPPLFGQGPQGVPGESATVAVGTVTSGSTAQVSNSGTNTDAVLDFTLPKGDKGDTGAGVPSGGTALQYVRKNSGNTATEWATIAEATTSEAGFLSPSDKVKLDGATASNNPDTVMYRNGSGSTRIGTLFIDGPTTHALAAVKREDLTASESATVTSANAYSDQVTSQLSSEVKNSPDPVANLANVEVLLSVVARPESGYFPQAISVNEEEGHIYIAFLATISAQRKIRVQRWRLSDNVMVDEKTVTTPYTNAGTEGLAWYYNSADELCFVVRGGSAGLEYQIFNYTLGTIGGLVTIKGGHKSAQEGDYFYTCTSGNGAYGVDTVYVYDWDSIKSGLPVLLNSIKLDAVPYPTKVQSFTVNGGYIIFSHGAHKEPAWISVYTMTGSFVRMIGIPEDKMFDLGRMVDTSLVDPENHESEGATVLSGQLLTGHALWNTANPSPGPFVILRHNVATGIPAGVQTFVPDNPWTELSMVSPAVADSTPPPAVIRDGNIVTCRGIVTGVPGKSNSSFATIPKAFAPLATTRVPVVVIGNEGYTASVVISTGGLVSIYNTNSPNEATTIRYQIDCSWRAVTE